MLKLNKKAEGEMIGSKLVYYLFFGIAISLLFVGFLFLVRTQGYSRTKIADGVEDYIHIQTFMANCLNYEDEDTKRAVPNLIDINKFTNEQIDSCYFGETVKLPDFRLTLINKEKKEDPKIIETKEWKGAISKRKTEIARIYQEGAIYLGELQIEIQETI